MSPTRIRIIVACVALAGAACKNKQDKSEPRPGDQASAQPAPEARSGKVAVGSDSPAGRALADFLDLKVPALGDAEACAGYKSSTSSFFISLGHELERMRAVRDNGFSDLQIAQLGTWLGSRGRMLDNMSSSIQTGELGRVHRELVAALLDVSEALSEIAADIRDRDAALTTRATNAITNLGASLAALEAACRGPG